MSRTGDSSLRLGMLRGLLAASAWLAMTASAGEDWTHRIRLAFQIGLNVDAQFSTGGDFSVSGSAPGPAGVPGVDHFYDNG